MSAEDLFDNSVFGIYRVGKEGNLVDVNTALVKMLRYGSRDELLARGPNADIFEDPSQHARLTQEHRDQLRVHGGGGVEARWKRRDGTAVTVRLSGRQGLDENQELTEFEVIVEDVTAWKALEEQFRQAQKMETVGRFAVGIAHDLNNALTVIIGYSSPLLNSLGTKDAMRADLGEICMAGTWAATMTRHLLAFSRRQVPEPSVLNLNATITSFKKILEHLIGEDISLEVILEPTLPSVLSDEGQIKQVFLNLVFNSRDAMPLGGKLTIETSVAYLDDDYCRQYVSAHPGDYVTLAVSDTGAGMNAETQSHLFEPFFTTKAQGLGTGLGLATSFDIVKQCGGHISFNSEPGKGSTFKIYLPMIVAEIGEGKSSGLPADYLHGSETVLVVEDSEEVRRVVYRILQDYGYRVLMARDHSEALEISRQYQGPMHLLLTDVVLPGMDGRELAEVLTRIWPQLKTLYMSGYTESAIARHGVLEPGIELIKKPFATRDLLQKVRQVLSPPRKQTPPED